jgi:tryptophanyl-tRNA synthetase
MMAEQTVTPFEAKSVNGFKYDKLIEQFGLELISEELLARFERVTGMEAHPWLKRDIFFSHQ